MVAAGAYLRAYRERLGLSQDDVAKALGKSQAKVVTEWEAGKRATALDVWNLIGNILDQPDVSIWNNLYSANGYMRESFKPADCDKALGQVRGICHTVINFVLSSKQWAKNTTEDFPFIRQGIVG